MSGGRVAGERRQQLLVRRGPRQLLDFDADARIGALELGKQPNDDLTFAPHRPEADDGDVGRALLAARQRKQREGSEHQRRGETASAGATAHCVVAVSQPPVKPARSRPLRTYAFLRITLQMRPLR